MSILLTLFTSLFSLLKLGGFDPGKGFSLKEIVEEARKTVEAGASGLTAIAVIVVAIALGGLLIYYVPSPKRFGP